MKLTHPKCGKQYNNTSRTGHCGNCCETFIGLAAFDAHQRINNGQLTCIEPTEGDNWWKDTNDAWHHGRKLTTEERERIFG